MALSATFNNYKIFLNDSELASPQGKSEEKVATKSVEPGTVVCRVAPEKPAPPKDIWLRCLIGTVLCLPVGAIALYRSNKVRPLYDQGEHDKAQKYFKSAKGLSRFAIAFGFCMWLFLLVYLLISFEHVI